jgi:hypothetical protein
MGEGIVTRASSSIFSNVLSKAILQLLPGGGALDVLVEESISRIQASRFEYLVDEIMRGRVEFDEETVRSDKFLHAFYITAKAATQSYHNEKIKMFAQLFTGTFRKDRFSNMDLYEELIGIIESLSIREVQILALLDEFETRYKVWSEPGNIMGRTTEYWKDFIDSLQSNLGLSTEIIPSILIRIQRTGLYEKFPGYGNAGTEGALTPLYYELKQYIDHETEAGHIKT